MERDRGGQSGRSRQGAVMELLRTIAHPPGGGGAKGCEAAAGRAAGGESRRKKAEEPPHQHGHPAAEVSRIITDPTTGKRYCRGKVLGKVMAAPSPVPSRGGGRCALLAALLGRAAGGRCPRGAAFPRRAEYAAAHDLAASPGPGAVGPSARAAPESCLRLGRARGKDLDGACGEWELASLPTDDEPRTCP